MNNMTSTAFERDKLIRFHHCDPAGIVFYPQYFVLFNELVEDWFNEGLGVDFAAYHVSGRLGIPMGTVQCRFLSPSKVGETLRLALTVTRIGRSSMEMHVTGTAGGETRVEATLTIVQASLDSRAAVPFSPDMRARLERYLAPGP